MMEERYRFILNGPYLTAMSSAGAVREGPDLDIEKLKNIIKSFLNNVDYLSEKRLHKLVYMAELKSNETTGERLTQVHFEPEVDGVCSPEISKTLRGMDEIKSDWVLIGGERVEKYNGDGYEVEINKRDLAIIEMTCRLFGDLSEKELSRMVKETEPYINSKFGEYIDFESIAKTTS